jgi:hypothetical protein
LAVTSSVFSFDPEYRTTYDGGDQQRRSGGPEQLANLRHHVLLASVRGVCAAAPYPPRMLNQRRPTTVSTSSRML